MKSVIIIRHAKSSWDNIIHSDFDRQLNERGHHDAPMMADRLLDKKIKIDAFISSPAKRAITTAAYFAQAFDVNENSIIKFLNYIMQLLLFFIMYSVNWMML